MSAKLGQASQTADRTLADNKGKRIGILIVAYNAVTTLAKVLKRIPSEVWENVEEVVVFDDAGRDDTYELAMGYKFTSKIKHLNVFKNENNLGYGRNQKCGYNYFMNRGFDVVVLLHGDGQYAPEIIANLYHPIVTGEADAVFGSRMMSEYGGALRGGMPLYKYVGNRILTSFENWSLGMNLTEFHSGYRAYSLAALRQIKFSKMTDDFHFDTEIIIKLHHQGFRIQEVPIPTYYGNEICYVNGLKYAKNVFKSVFRYQRTVQSVAGYSEYEEYYIKYPIKQSKYSSHYFFRKIVGKGNDVLDIGCGEGFFASTIAKDNRVVGIDLLSIPTQTSAFKQYINIDLESGLKNAFPELDGQKFDKVLLPDVIEHLRFPEPLLNDCHLVLNPHVGIGNDFESLYYVYKVYLLDHLSHFRIPLWSPSEGAGFPFYSNPFAETFYPLNLFLTVFYHLAGGYTRLDHQVFTILGLSIFGLGLFFWLRLLNLNLRAVIFATFVMSVSFKVSEILRFPNAVHTAAWYPWILLAITKVLLSQSLKESVKYGFLLVFFLICLFTGGYLYYVYYSLFLFGPYLLIFLVPKLRNKFFGNKTVNLKTSIFVLTAAGLSSLAICGPYLYKMSSLLRDTTDRGGKVFSYSTQHLFNFKNTIGSLIFPPAAPADGWCYFGILGVLLILLYFFSGLSGVYSLYAKPVELDKSKSRRWYLDSGIKLFFLVWIGTISYITYGRESYLFIFLWKYMPFFSSLRVWARMNIILVPIIAWILAIAYTNFEELISRNNTFPKQWIPISIVTGSYLAIFVIQYHIFRNRLYDHSYWDGYLKYLSSQDIFFLIFGVFACLILLFILTLASKIHFQSPRILAVVLAGLVLFSTFDMRNVGASIWIYPSPLETPKRYKLNVEQQNLESFSVPRVEGDTLPLTSTFSVALVENWYFNRYVQFFEKYQDELNARNKLLGVIDGRKLYFSQAINHPTLQAFLDDAAQFKDFERVISYTGDELTLEVRTSKDGYLSFIDNWDQDWKASVDGKSTPIELLFETFKSVRVMPGEHRVTFAYRPGWLPISQ